MIKSEMNIINDINLVCSMIMPTLVHSRFIPGQASARWGDCQNWCVGKTAS